MRKFLSILMLACLLLGMVLPVAAEGDEKCTLTEGCNKEDGHDGLCFVPCALTDGCTQENGHTGFCDALCSKTVGCILFGGHEGECQSLTSASVLNNLLSDKDALIAYQQRIDPSYAGGEIILQLPESAEYTDAIVVGSDMDGVALTLKGNKNTFKKGLVINGGRVRVDGIRFQRTDGRDVSIEVDKSGYDDVAIINCAFSGGGYDFQMIKGSEQFVPTIYLKGNTFSGSTIKAALRGDTHILGYWNVVTAATPEEVWLTLDATVSNYTDAYEKKCTEIQYADPGIRSLSSAGWKIYFIPNVTFSTVYAAHEGEQIIGTDLALYQKVENQNVAYYKFLINDSGKYELVEDDAPVLKDGKVVISKSQAEHLRKVIVKCTSYKAAEVTFNNSSVLSTMSSDGYLSFTLKTPNGDGTYNVKEVTKTVNKASTTAPTTRRSYNYKYQDYYLITPQRVTDCMRYAKDNLVTIECKEAGRRSISLPVASMAAAAEKGYSILLKNEKIADITMDAAALKSLAQQAKGTTVLLHYRSLNHKTLTTVGLTSVQSHLDQFPNDNADLAFLLTATSDSETIEDLQLGTITLKIPFIVLPGTEEMKNEVYALQSETAASARETTVGDGHLTTRLTDLTEHMVFQIGEPVETTEETTEPTVETTVETTQPETVPETTLAPEPEAEEKGFPIWIPIVAVLLLGGGGAAAWFLYLRKRFQK